MSAAVRSPLLVVGLDDMGERVVNRLKADARRLDSPPVRFLLGARSEPLEALQERLREAITGLTRTQMDGVRRGRLDVALIADFGSPGLAARARVVVTQLADLIGREFPIALPMSKQPSHRSVSLVALVGANPLVDLESVRGIHELVEANGNAPVQLLSRLYVVSRQHEGGTLSETDLERALYLFAASVWFFGLRDTEIIAKRVQHRGDTKLVCTFNAAAADVPMDSVIRYCALRTALAGIEVLAARCTAPPPQGASDPSDRIQVQDRLSALRDRAATSRTRSQTRRAELSGAVPSSFSWTVSSGRIQKSIEDLFGVGQDESVTTSVLPASSGEADSGLDRTELHLVQEASSELAAFVRTRLDPKDGLRLLPSTLRALDQAHAGLEARQVPPVQKTQPASVDAAPLTPLREAVRDQLARRSHPARLLVGTLGLSILGALFAASIWLAAATGSPSTGVTAPTAPPTGVVVLSSSQTSSTTTGWKVLALAALAGVLLGGCWFVVKTRDDRRLLKDAIERLEQGWRQNRSTATAGEHDAVGLDLRERRLSRALGRQVGTIRRRVIGVRTAVIEARAHILRELRSLGYQRDAREGRGDSSAVLGEESALHWRLFQGDSLERLWERTRETVEEEIWSQKLLASGWPEAGVLQSLPFEPGADWETKASVREHRRLLETTAFGWPEVKDDLVQTVEAFLSKAVDRGVVGMPAAPTNESGEPLEANSRTSFVLVAPREAKRVVDAARESIRFTVEKAWGVTPVSRIVVLRVHPGCDPRELAWGIRAQDDR